MANPLVSDRNAEFLLYEVVHAEELTALPYFADHGRETFDLILSSARKLAREQLFPAFKPMDEEPPRLVGCRRAPQAQAASKVRDWAGRQQRLREAAPGPDRGRSGRSILHAASRLRAPAHRPSKGSCSQVRARYGHLPPAGSIQAGLEWAAGSV